MACHQGLHGLLLDNGSNLVTMSSRQIQPGASVMALRLKIIKMAYMVNNIHDKLWQILVFLVNKTQFHKHIIWVPSLENLSSGLALRPCFNQPTQLQSS